MVVLAAFVHVVEERRSQAPFVEIGHIGVGTGFHTIMFAQVVDAVGEAPLREVTLAVCARVVLGFGQVELPHEVTQYPPARSRE